jgi:hypothetical protein
VGNEAHVETTTFTLFMSVTNSLRFFTATIARTDENRGAICDCANRLSETVIPSTASELLSNPLGDLAVEAICFC